MQFSTAQLQAFKASLHLPVSLPAGAQAHQGQEVGLAAAQTTQKTEVTKCTHEGCATTLTLGTGLLPGTHLSHMHPPAHKVARPQHHAAPTLELGCAAAQPRARGGGEQEAEGRETKDSS